MKNFEEFKTIMKDKIGNIEDAAIDNTRKIIEEKNISDVLEETALFPRLYPSELSMLLLEEYHKWMNN